ncbi:MAG TPA: hypothetical protein VLD67_21285, partial [Vicinamibacterales bacterium]|nr:hypothetical protein [Vicinamibacterales bacterium]
IAAERPTVWRVPIEGGRPERLLDVNCRNPSVSPDGRLIACFRSENGSDLGIAVFPFEAGPPLKVFAQTDPGSPIIRWTPDGRFLTYVENDIGGSKIWMQPLSGEERRLWAHFENERVFGFDWSPDGTRLACIRGFWSGNVVLLRRAT